MAPKALSLDVIQVNTPCTADWEKMAGDERVRFCEGCGKHVHNLAGMSRTEAERLVCERAGELCVRFARGEDGVVQTLDYRPLVGRGRGWKFWTVVSACAATLVAAANGYFFRPQSPKPMPLLGALPVNVMGKPAPPPVMGDVCVPTTQPPAQQGGGSENAG